MTSWPTSARPLIIGKSGFSRLAALCGLIRATARQTRNGMCAAMVAAVRVKQARVAGEVTADVGGSWFTSWPGVVR
jgi:hypothetical protein